MSSIIYTVTPFNEFALGSCFDEAYVPAFQCMGGDINQLLLNTCVYFRYMGDDFCVSAYDLMTQQEIEEKNGIDSIETKGFVDDILDKAIKCLNEGDLIMCRTSDAIAYNERLKRHTQKSTSLHWMLIYGYNTEKKVFNVLEHLTNVAAQYEPCIINFEDMTQAYLSGCKYEEDGPTMVIIKNKKQSKSKNTSKSTQYYDKCQAIEDKLYQSYESLRRYLTTLTQWQMKIKHYDLIVLNEVVRYFEKELWIQDDAGITIECGKDLLRKLYLVRAYGMKCLNNDNETNKNGLIKVSLEASSYAENWYQTIFASMKHRE